MNYFREIVIRKEEFESVFYPDSVGIVGASRDKSKAGNMFLDRLKSSGFEGNIYPINPNAEEINGIKAYESVKSVPGSLDHVIISISSQIILDVLDECGEKGVEVVHIFTAGFSETGDKNGASLEEKIMEKSNEYGFSIIGPNCIGAFCTRSKLPSTFTQLGEPGFVSFISQSGGHVEKLVMDGLSRGIKFSKGISIGNACDLDSADFLEYLSNDSETQIIALYLEGGKNGERLSEVLRETTKPVVVWKGGRTRAGARAASSHTASMSGSEAVWSGVLKQTGCVKVNNIQEWLDMILSFQSLSKIEDNKVALIGGLVDGAGGRSVAGSDACIDAGLSLPRFSKKVQVELENTIPQAGSIIKNPLDLSQVGRDLDSLSKVLDILSKSSNISLILMNFDTSILIKYRRFLKSSISSIAERLIDFEKSGKKQLAVVSPPNCEKKRIDIENRLMDAGIPVYPTLTRAAKALGNITNYWKERY